MQKDGWIFKGVILNNKYAFSIQSSVHEKDEKYVVSGTDSNGKNDLFEKISKDESEKRIKESIKKISKHMFKQIE